MAHAFDFRQGLLAEMPLDAVVDREVDGPGGEVSEDGGTKTAIHATETVVLDNVFDGVWARRGGKDVR